MKLNTKLKHTFNDGEKDLKEQNAKAPLTEMTTKDYNKRSLQKRRNKTRL